MKRFKYSRLYPKSWRAQFGDEFDLCNELKPPRFQDVLAILWHAALERATHGWPVALYAIGCLVIGFFNLVATEVQWCAGALLFICLVATAVSPRRWLAHTLIFWFAVPISQLQTYQVRNVPHHPMYETVVALIPALVGAALGGIVGAGISSFKRLA